MTTSFQAFKFIELYSLIQFFTVTLLYTVAGNITDHQFLFIDLIALVPLSLFSAWTGAYEKLTKHIPTATLFYRPVLLSVIMSAAI
jgi:cation-transporting ATPase 13A3/4/5